MNLSLKIEKKTIFVVGAFSVPRRISRSLAHFWSKLKIWKIGVSDLYIDDFNQFCKNFAVGAVLVHWRFSRSMAHFWCIQDFSRVFIILKLPAFKSIFSKKKKKKTKSCSLAHFWCIGAFIDPLRFFGASPIF